MLMMLFHLDDRMNFSSFLVFQLYVIFELVSLGYKSLVSHLGQGTFVYFVNSYFGPGFQLCSTGPCFLVHKTLIV